MADGLERLADGLDEVIRLLRQLVEPRVEYASLGEQHGADPFVEDARSALDDRDEVVFVGGPRDGERTFVSRHITRIDVAGVIGTAGWRSPVPGDDPQWIRHGVYVVGEERTAAFWRGQAPADPPVRAPTRYTIPESFPLFTPAGVIDELVDALASGAPEIVMSHGHARLIVDGWEHGGGGTMIGRTTRDPR